MGLDLQADGGTHVANTREVGRIRVTGYESKGRINKRIRIELIDATSRPAAASTPNLPNEEAKAWMAHIFGVVVASWSWCHAIPAPSLPAMLAAWSSTASTRRSSSRSRAST